MIGSGIGAASSVPVTNTLLASQIEAQSSSVMQTEASFGRPMGGSNGTQAGGAPGMSGMIGGKGQMNMAVDYISSVTSATDLTVLIQLLGIGVVLTLVASTVSIIFITRYEPLKILLNRD